MSEEGDLIGIEAELVTLTKAVMRLAQAQEKIADLLERATFVPADQRSGKIMPLCIRVYDIGE